MPKLNPFILVVVDNQLNPDKYTQEQLEDNADAAWDAYVAWPVAATWDADDVAWAADDAAWACADADEDATYWLDKYFTKTNENKQDYIEELTRG